VNGVKMGHALGSTEKIIPEVWYNGKRTMGRIPSLDTLFFARIPPSVHRRFMDLLCD